MKRKWYRIAGVTFSLDSSKSFQALNIPGQFRLFEVEEASPDLFISWEQVKRLDYPPSENLLYDPGQVWRMFRDLDGRELIIDIDNRSRWNSRPPRARLHIDRLWRNALLVERIPARGGRRLENLFSGIIELIIRTRVISDAGIAFHACGIDDNGTGILLPGGSGAGKSTQAGLWNEWPGVAVLNDDRLIVRMNQKRINIEGTPWGGSSEFIHSNACALKAILFIEKAERNRLIPIPPGAAFPLLAARAFLPYWDSGLMIKAFDVLDHLSNTVPAFRFRCRPEPAAVSMIRKFL